MTTTTMQTTTRHVRVPTRLGEVTLVADQGAVTGLYFQEHRRRPAAPRMGPAVPVDHDELLGRAAAQLTAYLAGERRTFDLPLRARGDGLAERVWSMLAEIPYGSTTTYGALADRLGDRALAQRVGQAVGRNPLCVLVPCHRVVGADGSLTGYAGGLDRKRQLLALEEPSAADGSRLW